MRCSSKVKRKNSYSRSHEKCYSKNSQEQEAEQVRPDVDGLVVPGEDADEGVQQQCPWR